MDHPKLMLGTPCFAENFDLLVRALRSFCHSAVEVVAIDNGGSADVKRALDVMWKDITIVRNPKNVYVNPAWNQLAERFLASDADILILANADLIAAPGWADTLILRHTFAKSTAAREFWFGRITHQIEEIDDPVTPSTELTTAQGTAGSFFAMTRDAVKLAFPVPSELLIWYGDGWIHTLLSEAGYSGVALRDLVCWHRGGLSTENVPERTPIVDRERVVWDTYLGAVCRALGAGIKNGTMDGIERRFIFCRDTPADINEHMETLRKYASECETVTEFGIGRSTWAFLHARPKRMRCYDICDPNFALRRMLLTGDAVTALAEEAGVDLRFERRDTLDLEIDPVDLLFIDTYHVYRHLKTELDKHGPKASKYIIMHDTEVFGERGEDGSTPGLWAAVEHFLAGHPEWVLADRFRNNNGLTILRRAPA